MHRTRRAVLLAAVLIAPVLATACNEVVPTTATFDVTDCDQVVNVGVGAGCNGPLIRAFRALKPGQSLGIGPGTYDVGQLRIETLGTPTQRITITARDMARRPVFKGWVHLRRARYTTVRGLRIQATYAGMEAMVTTCGVGWSIEDSELWGAAQTGHTANLYIHGRQPGGVNPDLDPLFMCEDEPRDFRVTGNHFHHPYTSTALTGNNGTMYHNVYVAYEGTSATGGVIERNLLEGNLNGAGVKLGDGRFETLGPWGVRVRYNTFYNGQRGVLLMDDVRNDTITGNLLVKMRGGGGATGVNVGIAYNRVQAPSNVVSHNYGYDLNAVQGPVRATDYISVGSDNRIGPDPRLDANRNPTTADAKRYGRTGTGGF